MSTPELIERIREVAERLVVCPMLEPSQRGNKYSRKQKCSKCGGSGEKPDSPYIRLLALVRVGLYGQVVGHGPPLFLHWETRSWDGMPDWWLATLLVSAAFKARVTLVTEASMGALMEDPDKAGAAVLAALERRESHGQV